MKNKKNIRISIRANESLVKKIQEIKEKYEEMNMVNIQTLEPYHPTTTDIIEEAIYNLWDFYCLQDHEDDHIQPNCYY